MEERNTMIFDEAGDLPRKVMTLFMLIDTSGSMTHEGNIDKVNRAVENTIQQLRDVSDSNFDAEIRIAILSFGSKVEWITNGAEPMDQVIWNDLPAAGLTPMGEAFAELERRLSTKEYLRSTTGSYAPVLLLLSDGQPTDNIDSGLNKLRHNNWYKVATKVAISVHNSADDVLAQFTGNTETVIRYDSNKQSLQKLLTTLAVVSSKMQSHSRPASELGTYAENGLDGDSAVATETAIAAVQTAQEESAVSNVDITKGWPDW